MSETDYFLDTLFLCFGTTGVCQRESVTSPATLIPGDWVERSRGFFLLRRAWMVVFSFTELAWLLELSTFPIQLTYCIMRAVLINTRTTRRSTKTFSRNYRKIIKKNYQHFPTYFQAICKPLPRDNLFPANYSRCPNVCCDQFSLLLKSEAIAWPIRYI